MCTFTDFKKGLKHYFHSIDFEAKWHKKGKKVLQSMCRFLWWNSETGTCSVHIIYSATDMFCSYYSATSVTPQHYQETLFSSIDSIYWLSSHLFSLSYLAFFLRCSTCHTVAAASYVLVITATKYWYCRDFFQKCIRMEKSTDCSCI